MPKPTPPPRAVPLSKELVEIVDPRNRPLAVLPLPEAHRQGLMHRAVLVLVFNHEKKVYLQKRSKRKMLYPGCWDLSATGHVQQGESCEDAAIRELREELQLSVPSLKLKQELPASADTGYEFISLFTAGRVLQTPQPNPEELETGYFFDPDELALLVEQFRELLTPGLVYFFERGLIFESRR